jgi:hypothetical protein
MRKEKLVALAAVTLILFAILPGLSFARPQNDAGSGMDAGNTQQTALFITPNAYTGTVYGPNEEDMSDYYSFTAYNGHWINVTMTPPSNMDFHLQLFNSTGHLKAGSYKGVNETESISYMADSDGTWAIHIFVNSNSDEGEYLFTIAPTNSPPEKPSAPSGPSTGYVYTYYAYTTSTTDPDGDTIAYQFDWNDSSTTTTINSYPSGQPVTISHQWKYPQTYYIKARAKDAHGLWSAWSDLKTVTLSQNDASSGGDAGNTPSTALPISLGSYKGTLYYPNPIDTVDFYNFSITVGDWMYVTMVPPSTADFQLEVHSPDGNVYGSYNGAGQMESINHRAEIGGIWSIRVSRYTGEGQYTFNLSITPGHAQLTVCVPQAPPEGVTIWIDGQAYIAYANTPVVVILATGTHTLEAERGFLKEEWMPGTYYIYTFQRWSDGVTANPRSINVTQNTTITAIYLRSKYGIQ